MPKPDATLRLFRAPVLLALSLLSAFCGGDGASGPAPENRRGGLKIVAAVSGGGRDADGFTVAVGTGFYDLSQDTIVVPDLQPGATTASIMGLASHCWTASYSAHATVPAGDTATLVFDIRCAGRYALLRGATDAQDLEYVDELGNARTLSSGPVAGGAAWSPDGSRIAFSQTVAGNQDLYIIRPDGTGLVRLTTDPNPDLNPVWSPDGRRLLYFNCPYAACRLASVGADGTGSRVVLDASYQVNDWAAVSWSPGGDRIAFSGYVGMESRIRTALPDGTGIQDVTTGSKDCAAAWSPDGSLIAFYRYVGNNQYGLMVVAPDGSGVRQIGVSGQAIPRPTWSPDSKRLSYLKYTGKYGVFTVNADGADERPLTAQYGFGLDPAWTGDGRHLYVTLSYELLSGIGIVEPDGTGLQLVRTGGGPRAPLPRP